MLRVKNLKKSFGKNLVFDNLSFQLQKGEVGILSGKSGVGKTTVMRCINGLEEFDSGVIEVNGVTINSPKEINKIRKDLGMVFQSFNLFPHMSVEENIVNPIINAYNISKEEALKKAIELLKLVDMEDKLKAYPHELSGGQKQRVAIARACALNPKVLCMDEPTSALDAYNIELIINIIKKLSDNGISILIITHDTEFANKVSDKFIYIKRD